MALDSDSSARYERISLLAVELEQGATGADGADSALLTSEDEDDSVTGSNSKRRRDTKQDGDEDDDYLEYDDDDDDDNRRPEEVDSDHERGAGVPSSSRAKPASKKRAAGKSATDPKDLMAAAAFGGTSASLFGDESDSQSVMSTTSSKRKKTAMKQAFPVRGVTCVGCALANRIGPVEKFVNDNVGRMSENALWKMAALTWKLEVVSPAKKEGVDVVDWPWREIAAHFRLHTTNPTVGRTHMIQSLTAMRCQLEGRLVRVENGERELDKVNADLALKVIAAESRERTLLANGIVGRGQRSKASGRGLIR